MNEQLLLTLSTIINLLWGLLTIFMDMLIDNDRFVYRGMRDAIPSGVQAALLVALLIGSTKLSFMSLSAPSARNSWMAVSFLLGYSAALWWFTLDHRLGPGLALMCCFVLIIRSRHIRSRAGAK